MSAIFFPGGDRYFLSEAARKARIDDAKRLGLLPVKPDDEGDEDADEDADVRLQAADQRRADRVAFRQVEEAMADRAAAARYRAEQLQERREWWASLPAADRRELAAHGYAPKGIDE